MTSVFLRRKRKLRLKKPGCLFRRRGRTYLHRPTGSELFRRKIVHVDGIADDSVCTQKIVCFSAGKRVIFKRRFRIGKRSSGALAQLSAKLLVNRIALDGSRKSGLYATRSFARIGAPKDA